MHLDGVSCGKPEPKMGINGYPTSDIVFENVRVHKSDLLGPLDKGYAVAMKTLDGGRLGVALVIMLPGSEPAPGSVSANTICFSPFAAGVSIFQAAPYFRIVIMDHHQENSVYWHKLQNMVLQEQKSR